MALVTVQRSPTPSTSSSPCVSVRAAFTHFTPAAHCRFHRRGTQIFKLVKAPPGFRFRCLFLFIIYFSLLLPLSKCFRLCARAHAPDITHLYLSYSIVANRKVNLLENYIFAIVRNEYVVSFTLCWLTLCCNVFLFRGTTCAQLLYTIKTRLQTGYSIFNIIWDNTASSCFVAVNRIMIESFSDLSN